jgi:hypothetical protein
MGAAEFESPRRIAMAKNGFKAMDSDIDTFLQLPFADGIKRKNLWDNCARLYHFE